MSDSRNYSFKQFAKIQLKVERQNKTIFFLLSALVSVLLVINLRGEDFTQTQDYTLFLLFMAIGLWITEAIPPFAVGILIIGFLVFTMGRNPDMDVSIYVQTWSDGVIWLFLGGFFLAEGMKKTKMDQQLLSFAMPKFGNKAKNVLLGLMMITALLSTMMSNTATTAMMIATVMPLFTTLGKDNPFSKALALGIPAAASIGGMGTIIGSAPNAVAVGALETIGIKITFLEWMVIGIPVAFLLNYLFWRVLVSTFHIKNQVLSLDFMHQPTARSHEYNDEEKIKKRIVALVLISTLFFWLTSQWTGIPVSAVSGIPIVALTMLGIIDADDVRSLPWDTLMLVAGGLALGLAIQEQGLAEHFIAQIRNLHINFYALIGMFGLVAVLLSNFMSNTAATTILIPVAISLTGISTGVDPYVLPVIIGMSASCALLLPVSTPPNAIAYSTGMIEQRDFRIGGIFVGLTGPVIIILWTLVVSYFLI